MPLCADARTLWSLVKGHSRSGTHAQRLQRFCADQAPDYDALRERLLQGRRQLIEALPVAAGARVVELGAGTGRNVEFFAERLRGFARVDLVDLCPALLDQAHARANRLAAQGIANLRVVCADATTYVPNAPCDCVYFSYALTMIPQWRAAIDNALRMLRPGGVLGVVDFCPPERSPAGAIFSRHWFEHDGVHLSAQHAHYLRARTRPEWHVQGRGTSAIPAPAAGAVLWIHRSHAGAGQTGAGLNRNARRGTKVLACAGLAAGGDGSAAFNLGNGCLPWPRSRQLTPLTACSIGGRAIRECQRPRPVC